MACENDDATPSDSFLTDVEEVAEAGRRACEAIIAAIRALERGRDARAAGRSLAEVVEDLIRAGGRGARLDASEAFVGFERSLNVMRAGVVRALVDGAGLSMTEAAGKMGISRQSAAKLYRRMREERQWEGHAEK